LTNPTAKKSKIDNSLILSFTRIWPISPTVCNFSVFLEQQNFAGDLGHRIVNDFSPGPAQGGFNVFQKHRR
jgi:hypothetical protein